MAAYIKSAILAGIVLFIWGFVSWMILPWHAMTLHQFKSDLAVSQIIQANAPTSGIYILPSMQQQPAADSKMQEPMVFASVNLNGMPSSMVNPMLISLATQIIAAFFVAWLLSKTSKLGYWKKVWFVMIFALAAAIISMIPAWNWFGFDACYTLVMMADILIGWYFAGLVLARYIK